MDTEWITSGSLLIYRPQQPLHYLNIHIYILLIYCVYGRCVPVPQPWCGSQRTPCKPQFSLPIMWIPGWNSGPRAGDKGRLRLSHLKVLKYLSILNTSRIQFPPTNSLRLHYFLGFHIWPFASDPISLFLEEKSQGLCLRVSIIPALRRMSLKG